jgi:hypothetical protein
MFSNFIYHRRHSDSFEPPPETRRKTKFINALIAIVLTLVGSVYWLFPDSTVMTWIFGVAVWMVNTLYIVINVLTIGLITIGFYQSYVKQVDLSDWMTYSSNSSNFWPMHVVTLFLLLTMWQFDWVISFWTFIVGMLGCRLGLLYMRLAWRRMKLGPIFT